MTTETQTDGRANKNQTAFRMSCAVAINIKAPPSRVWSLLTTAQDFPRWNSTVTSIEGAIALGQKIKVKVTNAPGRVFNLKVREFEPDRNMVWADGMAPMFTGVRTYTLTPKPDGSTDFFMEEVFKGLMLPMIKGSLPDFGPTFEQYVKDLKREAEVAELADRERARAGAQAVV